MCVLRSYETDRSFVVPPAYPRHTLVQLRKVNSVFQIRQTVTSFANVPVTKASNNFHLFEELQMRCRETVCVLTNVQQTVYEHCMCTCHNRSIWEATLHLRIIRHSTKIWVRGFMPRALSRQLVRKGKPRMFNEITGMVILIHAVCWRKQFSNILMLT
jgi:hypothetical protein